MELGREAMSADAIPVYVMPKMKSYLETNGPWSQLVKLKNINLILIHDNQNVILSETTSITPFSVPHRDEFSETVGYKISSTDKSALFIPDIDKWDNGIVILKKKYQKLTMRYLMEHSIEMEKSGVEI